MLLSRIEAGEFFIKGEGLVTFLNPYSYLIARNSFDLFSSFDEIYADGALLVLFLRCLGVKVGRYSFDMTSLAPVVFSDCASSNKSVYFLGGEPGVAESAVKFFCEVYPLRVVGCRNGFFDSKEDLDSAITDIVSLNPSVLVCGMGTPYQEKFLFRLRGAGWAGRGYTCGGFLHQTAKKGVCYYPSFFDKFNLRWVYRVFDEPKLFKRYLFEYPKFFLYALFDYFSNRKTH